MSVSNEQLDELIGFAIEKGRENTLAAFLELQRYRQAATAGVEEAANKLVRFVEAKISEWLPGELTGPLAAEYERRKVSVRRYAVVECD